MEQVPTNPQANGKHDKNANDEWREIAEELYATFANAIDELAKKHGVNLGEMSDEIAVDASYDAATEIIREKTGMPEWRST